MGADSTEQALRCEAIRRHLEGERRCDICRDLARSSRWFSKWWAEYQQNPQSSFADHSRAPHTVPGKTPDEIVHAIVSIRKALEAATTPETRYGLIGAPAIQAQLDRLGLPVPSPTTIQRILQQQELTHPLGAGYDAAYYPWLEAWAVNAIHATDIITRHLWGGDQIQNFHTIDHYSHAVTLSQCADKTSATACAHLLETWRKLGLPHIQQFDNEDAFRGGHMHPRVIGQIVRLCLFCGVEPVFTPYYDPKRNYQIETFHSLWLAGFWSRYQFRNRRHVQTEIPLFERWYHTVYRPPALQGRTPAQVRRGAPIVRLEARLRQLIPLEHLPITAGKIHFFRKVETTGDIDVLNETWSVGEKWIGHYVCVTINTAEQRLTVWHQQNADSPWQRLHARAYRLREPVEPVLPAFRRKCARCPDYLPG